MDGQRAELLTIVTEMQGELEKLKKKPYDIIEVWNMERAEIRETSLTKTVAYADDLERENAALQKYAKHPPECHIHYKWTAKGYCDCGLDELLKQGRK